MATKNFFIQRDISDNRILEVSLKSALISLMDIARAYKIFIWSLHQNHVLILNLHRVSPEENPFSACLHPKYFDYLIRFLIGNFEVISFSSLHEWVSIHKRRPLVILSFDDGYYDFIEYAVPIMEKYGVRSNQNIISECVLGGSPPWTIEVRDFIQHCSNLLLSRIEVPGLLEPPERSQQYANRLVNFLKKKPYNLRLNLMKSLNELMRNSTHQVTRMMNVKEVRQISHNHEIGCHSYSHESMGLESINFFTDDLEKSMIFHREYLGKPPIIYSFPNGSYRNEQVEKLSEKGFKHVLLVDERIADCNQTAMPRFSFNANSQAEVRMAAVGALPRIRHLIV